MLIRSLRFGALIALIALPLMLSACPPVVVGTGGGGSDDDDDGGGNGGTPTPTAPTDSEAPAAGIWQLSNPVTTQESCGFGVAELVFQSFELTPMTGNQWRISFDIDVEPAICTLNGSNLNCGLVQAPVDYADQGIDAVLGQDIQVGGVLSSPTSMRYDLALSLFCVSGTECAEFGLPLPCDVIGRYDADWVE